VRIEHDFRTWEGVTGELVGVGCNVSRTDGRYGARSRSQNLLIRTSRGLGGSGVLGWPGTLPSMVFIGTDLGEDGGYWRYVR